MERVFNMYRLKAGVSIEEYIKFSQDLDQVVTAHRPGVLSFEAHIIAGSAEGSEVAIGADPTALSSNVPYHVIETIDVANWAAWMRVVASDEMAPVRDAWELVADSTTTRMILGRPI